MNIRLLAVIAIGPLLGACNFQTISGSVAGGECKVFARPPYAVLGKTSYDQNWIDDTVEGGVGGCRWKRPAPRPAELDAVPGQKVVVAPPRKRGLIRRIKDRVLPVAKKVWPGDSVAPVIPIPQPSPLATPAAPIEPPPAPQPPPPPPKSAVDELLNPTTPIPPVRRVR